jgi:hypothetical protein
MPKKKPKKLEVIYTVVGTPEENQEKLDRVFDFMFSKVDEKRKIEKDNGAKNDFR